MQNSLKKDLEIIKLKKVLLSIEKNLLIMLKNEKFNEETIVKEINKIKEHTKEL